MEHIDLFYPNIFKEEWLAELAKVFDGRWLGQGPLVDEFERQFAAKFNYDYCLAVNSGSAALELAYHLAGIGIGDEVLTPVFTCTATNIPLLRRKAKIKFLDINRFFLTVDFDDLAKKITPKTKAIVVATIGGLPIDPRIFEIAKDNNIPVIIDAAQSLGIAETAGDYICYSFQAIKHFTTGDGGMLVVRNETEYQRAKKLRWFGIDREAKKQANWQWQVNHKMALDIDEPGYKFHMNDMAAALGLVGLKHSNESRLHRINLCNAYAAEITDSKIYGGAYWLFAILTDHRDEVMECLRAHEIECDLVQMRNDVFKVFGGRQVLPNMDKLESQYLYLPLHPKLSLDDISHITNILKQCKSKFQSPTAVV
jgi:dTDP-4-amino-4,6-dideoxygalactose transaminase